MVTSPTSSTAKPWYSGWGVMCGFLRPQRYESEAC
jgi:hypothetical protein